nr:MAG TPA: hypothetical protein [Caudoviricetes sp.]
MNTELTELNRRKAVIQHLPPTGNSRKEKE